MTDLTPYDVHRIDQAAVDAFADVDELARDPRTLNRLTEVGPAVYGVELANALHYRCGGNPDSLAGLAALAVIRLVQANERLMDLNTEVGLLRMFKQRYFEVQELLDEVLGPDEADRTGEGIVQEVHLVAQQRDEARKVVAALSDLIGKYGDDGQIPAAALRAQLADTEAVAR